MNRTIPSATFLLHMQQKVVMSVHVPIRDFGIVEALHEPALGARHLCRFTDRVPSDVEAA
jgi:hypothetical protein